MRNESSDQSLVEGVEGIILEGEASTTNNDGVKSSREKKNKSSSSSASPAAVAMGPLPLPTLCTIVKGRLLKERHHTNVIPMLVAFLSIVKV